MRNYLIWCESSHSEVFLRKGVLKVWCKFIGEHPCQSLFSIKLQSSFIEIALRYWCSPVNLLHIFSGLFPRNTCGWLLLLILTIAFNPHSTVEFTMLLILESVVFPRCSSKYYQVPNNRTPPAYVFSNNFPIFLFSKVGILKYLLESICLAVSFWY